MYDFISGKIEESSPAHVVIDNAGIGYFLNISLNTFSMLKDKTEVKLLVEEIIREDAHNLFGFAEREERDLFRNLISVSGIGPNTARMMLSSLQTADLRNAILTDDVNQIKSVKGIGLKTAQRVIVELKDKLGKDSFDKKIFTPSNNTLRDEALSALVMLGFQKAASQKVVEKILIENPDTKVETIIKSALKML